MDGAALERVLDGSQFDGFDPEAALTAIRSPVHLLAGDVTVGGTIDRPERLASLVGRYTCRTLPGVGHFIHHTVPADYVQELAAFAEAC
jgi:pimeloyl-ACP methyl ester carboxylesterase